MTARLHLSSGRGPAECAWVVARLIDTMHSIAAKEGLSVRMIEFVPGDVRGTYDSAVVEVEGADCNRWAQQWMGTVQWIGTSPFRPRHKRRNWFVRVGEAPYVSGPLVVDEADVRFEAFRGSGPGGQHRNKVSTAIRATHLPTGITVEASSERSQMLNRKAALEQLSERLQLIHEERAAVATHERWRQHDELERGNAVKVFTGPNFTERR